MPKSRAISRWLLPSTWCAFRTASCSYTLYTRVYSSPEQSLFSNRTYLKRGGSKYVGHFAQKWLILDYRLQLHCLSEGVPELTLERYSQTPYHPRADPGYISNQFYFSPLQRLVYLKNFQRTVESLPIRRQGAPAGCPSMLGSFLLECKKLMNIFLLKYTLVSRSES
jgi:hypothetical protein